MRFDDTNPEKEKEDFEKVPEKLQFVEELEKARCHTMTWLLSGSVDKGLAGQGEKHISYLMKGYHHFLYLSLMNVLTSSGKKIAVKHDKSVKLLKYFVIFLVSTCNNSFCVTREFSEEFLVVFF